MENILYKFKNEYATFEITPFENNREKDSLIVHMDVDEDELISNEEILEMIKSEIKELFNDKTNLDNCKFVKKEDGYTYIILPKND
ncbi:hypothetical protein [Methanococcus voltae]|uniref:Uncharacterized protein n=2 Tax=Methanococcus voltae TaxID=2188 RepID=A0A8J7UT37_METVO|nr:hypothetical protein [Methanococcus voltae]MBP2173213.1 hypothetical protein [Methanococcus voltae]MBP2201233.1 hypothetical protein [Methanococcus voltae]MCS3922943.1 hypothetical protein [Methanococcus voltae PS]